MAFVAGDIVVSKTIAQVGQKSFVGSGLPLLGGVVSVGGGNVEIGWANGTESIAKADGLNSLVKVINTSAAALSLYHKRVAIDPAAGFPNEPAAANGLGSSEGIVIGVFTITGDVDFAVVEFTGGDVWVFSANLLVEF